MKPKPLFSLFFSVMVCFALLAGLAGCKKSNEILPDPAGVLTQTEGCKTAQNDTGLNGIMEEGVNDCIVYSYNGRDTLILKHINTGFNCCPGEITAGITVNGSTITIEEAESEQGCHCLCLFDLSFEVVNLKPAKYSIRVIEPYAEEGDQVLEFELDLLSSTSGEFCLKRTYYPWN